MGLFSSLFVLTLLRDAVELVLWLAGAVGLPKVPGHWQDLSAIGVVALALLVTWPGFSTPAGGRASRSWTSR